MKNKILYIILIGVLISLLSGAYLFFMRTRNNNFVKSFENLSDINKHKTISLLRDMAIKNAIAGGDYRCCIEPVCTMCYMEANKWNNFTAGTCACDDLIAKGEEACPQCQRGLKNIHAENNTFCDINAKTPTCASSANDR